MEPDGLLARNRAAWDAKPGLRLVYEALYRRLAALLVAGPTLEIGAGTGNFKSFAPDVVASDIQFAPWLDLVADAQRLPVRDGAFGNAVLVDVLHHLPRPVQALRELARALRPGGRIVMAEPAITPLSAPFYYWLHHEPVDFGVDPFADGPLWPEGDPYASNQAIPTIYFSRRADRFAEVFPELRVASRRWVNLLAYPLSGGFQSWSLLPAALARPLIAVEDALCPVLGRLAGFRLLVALEKR